MVKAIETVYQGYRFRSRLEARWAVFFDTLGIEYHYELQGYDFDGIRYLPDFWLPELDCWIEIKGPEPTEEELQKTHLLALYIGKRVYTFFGDIWLASQQKYGGAYLHNEMHWEQGHYWCVCSACNQVTIASFAERTHTQVLCQCNGSVNEEKIHQFGTPLLLNAYTAARQARFEFGEKGIRTQKPQFQEKPSLPDPVVFRFPTYVTTSDRKTYWLYKWCEHCFRWTPHRLEDERHILTKGCVWSEPI